MQTASPPATPLYNANQNANLSRRGKAALRYAAKGLPVFPCYEDEKRPLTTNGFKDATMSAARITGWWKGSPNANIATPTGKVFVVDEDAPGGIAALEAEYRPLPRTLTARTPSGGTHRYYRAPEDVKVRCSVKEISKSIDVRGHGGYVLLPPSSTVAGEYEWIDRSPIADAPEWLLKAVTEKPRKPREDRPGQDRVTVDPAGEPIAEGGRNNTLTRIAGRLHDGTRTVETLEIDLLAINKARCTPPLPVDEVRRIAASIHRLEPCAPARGENNPEVAATLVTCELLLTRRHWPGRTGKTDRSVYKALILLCRMRGGMIPAGVRVTVGYRALALFAGTGYKTCHAAVKRLKVAGLVRGDGTASGTSPGALVLLVERAQGDHKATTAGGVFDSTRLTSDSLMRAPALRWSAPGQLRLGKTCEAAVDVLARAGGGSSVEDLTRALGMSRARDVRKRIVSRLVDAGVAALTGDLVTLVGDWLSAIDEERKIAGEIRNDQGEDGAEERDRDRYARQSEGWAEWLKLSPVERKALKEERRAAREGMKPTVEEREERRRYRADMRASSGFIPELRRIKPLTPDQLEDLEAVYEYERQHGVGSFEWSQAGFKQLFYATVTGRWPDRDSLEALKAEYDQDIESQDIERSAIAS